MHLSRPARILLRIGTGITLAFIYVPLIVIIVYAFNESRIQSWPIEGLTLNWFERAIDNPGARDAVWTSVKAAVGATVIALVLGTLASIAVARYKFFGRETISFLVILPLALPGIVTGMALNATLRRVSTSFEEASADLGATAFQTFRHVTFPALRSALLAGGLLAFALSFDEVIVTTFTAGADQTLPIWILTNLSRPNQLPVVNVVAVFLIVVSFLPVYLAQRLTRDTEGGGLTPTAAAR
jgi:putative spermidine/putrescine transport system permease protein